MKKMMMYDGEMVFCTKIVLARRPSILQTTPITLDNNVACGLYVCVCSSYGHMFFLKEEMINK